MADITTLFIPEGFVCDTEAKAGILMRAIKQTQDDADYIKAWHNEQAKKAQEQADFEVERIKTYLREYFNTVPHHKTKTQESFSFPGGKLMMKKQNPEYKRDDKTVIEWLKANKGTEFIKTKEELAWQELKDASTGVVDGKIVLREETNDDGEIIQITVPGIEVIPREDKFEIEVK